MVENEKKTITLQIDVDLINKLNKIAEEEDRSLSSVIRKILKEYIIKNEEKTNE